MYKPPIFRHATPLQLAVFSARIENATDPSACWIWNGTIRFDGYGQFAVLGAPLLAHRAAYFFAHGSLPPYPPLCLDHLCRNRACVNPAHLEAVTIAENVRRGVQPVRRIGARSHVQ